MSRRSIVSAPVVQILAIAATLALGGCSGADIGPDLEQAGRLLDAGRATEAVRILDRLAARSPDNPKVLYRHALALHAAGRDDDALRQVNAALAVDPSSIDARFLRGTVLGALGRDEEGLADLRQVVQADPRRPGVHRAMALIHARAGRNGQAVNQFEKELTQSPDDVETLTDLGIFYLQTAQYEQAADRLRRAATLPSATARAHRWYGELLIRQSKREDGLEEQRKALALAPDDIDLLVSHARALQGYGHREEATKVLQAAVDRGVNDPRLHVELGRQAREALAYDEAIVHYKRAIAIDSSNAEAHLDLAKAYLYMGRHPEARVEFEEAHRLAPTDPYSPYYLATLLMEDGSYEGAIPLLRRALELDSLNPKAHYALAQALQRVGRTDEAQVEFDRHAEIMKRLHESRGTTGIATME